MKRSSPEKDDTELLKELLENPSGENSFALQNFFKTHPLQTFFLVAGGILLLASLVFLWRNLEEQSQVKIIPAEEGNQASSGNILVHIAGAVQKPGLYKLPFEARINDALAAAGGLSSDANRVWFEKNINLAQKISDGVKIYIPFANEPGGPVSQEGTVIIGAKTDLVNINTASQGELESLPKIGPVLAKRIVEYRQQKGQFSSVEDLIKVSGISQTTLENIRNQIIVF